MHLKSCLYPIFLKLLVHIEFFNPFYFTPCTLCFYLHTLFQPVLLGPMGIGKSSCQDVLMWNLCGSKEVSKIDSDTRNTTVKQLAALKTFPTTIEVYGLTRIIFQYILVRTTQVRIKKKISLTLRLTVQLTILRGKKLPLKPHFSSLLTWRADLNVPGIGRILSSLKSQMLPQRS